ncbi:MAG: 50S ribosomal protein L19 [Candidatus Cryptobacteroides sp.]
MDYIKIVEQAFANEKAASYPQFKAGDTITVTYKIKEGDKERLQKFRGVVIQLSGTTAFTRTFTIRKISSGVGVERIFPMQSPFIESIEVNKIGKVRRARIFYLRDLQGKKAKIKEKKANFVKEEVSE